MTAEQLQEVAFQIILESGDSRNLVHESFQLMRESKFEETNAKLEEANDAILRAHQAQSGLLHSFAGGTKIEVDVLLVHSQDHLMTTMTLREVAVEMLHLYKKMANN